MSGAEIAPEEGLGYLTEETIITAHHEAVEGREPQWHFEVARTFPNGGRTMVKVVDVPGVEPVPAWDETEDILRWNPYTTEELAARAAEAAARQAAEIEAMTVRASDNIEFGAYFEADGMILYATASIVRGEAIRPGINCEQINLSDILSELKGKD